MSAFPIPAIRKRGPILNGLTSLPASLKMLTVDDAGNMGVQDIPVAPTLAWGNITGTLSAQTDLQAALNAKSSVGHVHSVSDVTGLSDILVALDAAKLNTSAFTFANIGGNAGDNTSLSTALAGKANSTHTHAISDVTNLQSSLDAKANSSALASYLPLAGGTLTGGLSGTTAAFSGNFSAANGTFNGRLIASSGYESPVIGTTGHVLEFPSITGFLNLTWGTRGTGFSDRCQLHFQPAHNMRGFAATNEGLYVGSGSLLGFSAANPKTDAPDTVAYRDAANTWGFRNGANAQRFNLYGTYTDASNYRRLYISSTTAGTFTLGVEGLGTGASGNSLSIINASALRAFDGIAGWESGGTLTIRGGVGQDSFYGASSGTIVLGPANNVGGGGLGAITITSGTTSRTSVMNNNNGITVKVGNATVNESYPAALELQGSEITHTANIATGGSINLRTYGGTVSKGGNAGAISALLGTGGTNTQTSGVGGAGGAFNITGGAGGAASGIDGIGGIGSTLTFTSGAGGASNGASGTRVGGNSGNIIFNIGAVGIGTTSNGSFGSVIWQQGGTERFRLTSAGDLDFAAGRKICFRNSASGNGGDGSSSRFLQIFLAAPNATNEQFYVTGGGFVYSWAGMQVAGIGNGYTCAENGAGYVFGGGWGGMSPNSNSFALGNRLSSPYGWQISYGAGYGIDIGNGANSGRLSLYNTFTNTSNYIRQSLSFTTYSGIVYAQHVAEGLGTGAVNIPFVITPRGTGAFILGPIPDGTATGGNARGTNAIDLQTARSAATQVASGASSVIFGGSGNTASGGSSGCGGESSVASGYGSFAWGLFTAASATYAVAFARAAAAAPNSFATGFNARSDRNGQFSHANGSFSTGGDAQRSCFVVRNTTTNATPTSLLTGAEWSGAASVRLTVNAGEILGFIANITGSKSDGSAIAHYVRKGAIKRVGTTTTLAYVETVGTDYEDNAATDVSITADDTNDALQIQVTGIAGETWRWVATVEAVDLGFGT